MQGRDLSSDKEAVQELERAPGYHGYRVMRNQVDFIRRRIFVVCLRRGETTEEGKGS